MKIIATLFSAIIVISTSNKLKATSKSNLSIKNNYNDFNPGNNLKGPYSKGNIKFKIRHCLWSFIRHY